MKKIIAALLSFLGNHAVASDEAQQRLGKIIILYPPKRKKKAKLLRMF